MTKRFASLLRALPPLPIERILDLGCGDAKGAIMLAARYPGATIYGIDYDLSALRCVPPCVQPVLADVRQLPFNARFGLIVIRHPDVFRSAAAWKQALQSALELLVAGGVLIVTCYSIAEADRLRAWLAVLLLQPIRLSTDLAAVDQTGQDRFAFALRA